MEHTPLPWIKGPLTRFGGPRIDAKVGDKVLAIADLYETDILTDGSAGTGEANADFIVRAVNSHDELLEACKQTVSAWNYLEISKPMPKGLIEAIAKAEGAANVKT